jgi:membrane-bound lytic murein transglycosylase D
MIPVHHEPGSFFFSFVFSLLLSFCFVVNRVVFFLVPVLVRVDAVQAVAQHNLGRHTNAAFTGRRLHFRCGGVVMNRTISIAVVLCAGACVRPSVPTVQTAPAPLPPTPVATAPTPVVQQATPVAAEPKPVLKDSVRVDASDVTRRATDVFGAAPPDSAVVPDSAAPGGPSWDIEVHSYESTARVERYVRMFSGPAKDRIESRLQRGTRYEPMIRARMREGGLPEDMYYLALVESGFDPNAYSRAAAVGMWQFMTSTARDMGMRVDWWVDERRDPFRSTTAAVQFIKGLREQFGSLYLAAAAYNGGPGRIARGLTRYADDLEGTSGDDLFFALAEKDYLRNETREYVPQLIAAALIAKEPERYGMKITPLPPVTYDSVRVAPSTSLAAVARAAGASTDDIKELNSHLLRGVTPPRDSFYVRIPTGSTETFTAAFAEMPKSSRLGLFTVESKKGESLESIAEKNGIRWRQLASFNPKLKKLKSGKLVPGQPVYVPTAAVASIAASIPDPDIEHYGTSTKSGTMHVVKHGETLSGIAKKYGTTSDALMKMNGLKRALIFPGQSLVVAGGRGLGAGRSSAKGISKKKTGVSKKKTPAKKKTKSK